MLVWGGLPLGIDGHKVKAEIRPESTVVYDLSTVRQWIQRCSTTPEKEKTEDASAFSFSRAGAKPGSDYEIQAIAVGTRLELEKWFCEAWG